MSERISVVVPDGTIERLKRTADCEGRSQSNLVRKFIIDGISMSEPLTYVLMPDGTKDYSLDGKNKSKMFDPIDGKK